MKPSTRAGRATLKYFWDTFTAPMIANSGAELIFIVGANARNTFNAVCGGTPLNFGDIRSFTAPSERNYQLALIETPAGCLGNERITGIISRLTGNAPLGANDTLNPAIMQNVQDRINALY